VIVTIPEFLSHVRDLGINLWPDGDDLCYSAPRGAVAQELVTELVERKAEILAFLRETRVAAPSDPDPVAPEMAEAYVAPRGLREETLARIWAEVLCVKRVGIHDNFFELGGDSLQALQVVTRAKRAGLQLVALQILEYQTIAELAAVEGTIHGHAEQGLVTGPVSLTMDQYIFLEGVRHGRVLDPHWRNIAEMFEVQRALDPASLEIAVRHLLVHHDALRTRFVYRCSTWQALIAEPGAPTPFFHMDLTELPEQCCETAIEAVACQLQQSLNLSRGPLLRVALFSLGAHRPDRLLIVAHHNLVDDYSMTVLREDLLAACGQLDRGEQLQLPPKTTSLKEFIERFNAYVRSTLDEELEYWQAIPWAQILPLPVDYPSNRENATEASTHTLRISLGADETRALLRRTLSGHAIVDRLLTALVQAIVQWTGEQWVKIRLIESLRAVPFAGGEDIDLSRTVASLSSHNVLLLKRENTCDPGKAIESIAERLRQTPNLGRGYFLLRQCGKDTEKVRSSEIYPDLVFNYLGILRQRTMPPSLLQPAQEFIGPSMNPQNRVWCLIYCAAYVSEGYLWTDWTYSRKVYKPATVEGIADHFAETLRSFVRYTGQSHLISLQGGMG
jgi:non-ribosomal peptide synthase protein (TIGR01720 family)